MSTSLLTLVCFIICFGEYQASPAPIDERIGIASRLPITDYRDAPRREASRVFAESSSVVSLANINELETTVD